MLKNNIIEINLALAEKDINPFYFYCKHFQEVGIKFEGTCGRSCKGYKPRNKKSGICTYYGYTYLPSNKCFTLKLTKL